MTSPSERTGLSLKGHKGESPGTSHGVAKRCQSRVNSSSVPCSQERANPKKMVTLSPAGLSRWHALALVKAPSPLAFLFSVPLSSGLRPNGPLSQLFRKSCVLSWQFHSGYQTARKFQRSLIRRPGSLSSLTSNDAFKQEQESLCQDGELGSERSDGMKEEEQTGLQQTSAASTGVSPLMATNAKC